MVETSSSFYQNYSPSQRKSVRSPPSDNVRDELPDYQIKQEATYESPRKRVTKREPKGREFNEVKNEKINVDNVSSRVNTGLRRSPTISPSPRLRRSPTISPSPRLQRNSTKKLKRSPTMRTKKSASIEASTQRQRRKSKRTSPNSIDRSMTLQSEIEISDEKEKTEKVVKSKHRSPTKRSR